MKINPLRIILGAALLLATTPRSRATDGVWISDADGSWNNPANWAGGVIADGTDGIAYFTNNLTAIRTITVDAGRVIGHLVFGDGDTNSVSGWLLTGSPLALRTSSGVPLVTVDVMNEALGMDPTNDVRFTSTLLATNGFTKKGPGTLTVTVANAVNLPGAVQMDEGVVCITTQTALAQGHNLVYNGGTLRMMSGQSGLPGSLTNVVLTTGTIWSSGLAPGVPRNNLGSTLVLGNSSSVLNLRLDLELLAGANGPAGSNQFANFNGTINIIGGLNNFRCDPGSGGSPLAFGSKTARFNLGTGTNALTSRAGVPGANHVHYWGAVSGGPTTFLRGSQQADNALVTYQVGDAGVDTTFGGVIQNGNNATRLTAINKSGAGKWTLANTNTYSGNTTIASGTLALETNGALATTPVIQLASSSATFDVSSYTPAGGWANNLNQILGGFGTITGTVVIASGFISPGTDTVIGRLTFANDLTLTGTVTNKVSFGTNDSLLVKGNLNLVGVSTVQIATPGLTLIPNGTYPLFKWNGTLTGDLSNLSLAYAPQVGGATIVLQTNLVTQQILLVVSNNSSGTLTWRGDGSGNAWDHATPNWRSSGSPAVFSELDSVTFDDTGSNNVAVNIAEVVTPSSVTINNTNRDYVFSATLGKITGVTGMAKNGPGKLTILEDNDFTGPVSINAGTVQVGNGSIGAGSLGSGTLNINGKLIYNRDTTVTIPSPLSGGGTLVQDGTNGILVLTANSTHNGGILVNAGTLQFGDGISPAGTVTTTVTNNSTIDYLFSSDITLLNGLAGNGIVNYKSSSGTRTYTFPTDQTNSQFNGTMNIFAGVRVHAQTGNGGFNFGNGTTVNVPVDGQAWLDTAGANYNSAFIIAGNGWSGEATPIGALRLFNCTLTGPITLTGNSRIAGSSSGATIQGPISGDPFQLEVFSTSANPDQFVLTLAPSNSVNAYGPTLVTSGVLQAGNSNALSTNALTVNAPGRLRLNGNNVSVANLSGFAVSGTALIWNNSTTAGATLTFGADGNSTSFDGVFGDGASQPLGLTKTGAGTFSVTGVSTNTGAVTVNGGTLALSEPASFARASRIAVNTGTFFDVTGRGDQTLTLNSGQTLSGGGTVNGSVVALAGSTIAPGNSVGTLTVANNITLGGNLLMEVDRTLAPNSDRLISSGGSITGGGTLTLTNIGPALQPGNTFQFFAGGVSGITANLPSVDYVNARTYTWQNNLATSGSVQVLTSTAITAPTLNVGQAGNNLTFSWSGPFKLQVQTNALNIGLSSNWANYPGGSTSPVIVPINPSTPTAFFRLSLQ
jgi:fibronectin-binding autotransporter adhesin